MLRRAGPGSRRPVRGLHSVPPWSQQSPACFLPVTKGRPTPAWPWWSTWPRSTCSWTADTSSGWRGMRALGLLPSLEAGGICAVKTVPARGRRGHTSTGLGLASCLHPPHPHLGTNPGCVDDHVCVSEIRVAEDRVAALLYPHRAPSCSSTAHLRAGWLGLDWARGDFSPAGTPGPLHLGV